MQGDTDCAHFSTCVNRQKEYYYYKHRRFYVIVGYTTCIYILARFKELMIDSTFH